MLLTISESTSQANTFPAAETNVGGFVEVKRTLTWGMTNRRLLTLA
jgi:hypothetical protein